MNQTKQKEREAYEPPVVTDIAPVTVAGGETGGSNVDDNPVVDPNNW